MDIEEHSREIIAEHLAIERDRISRDTFLIRDLDADRLDIAELAMNFEEQFDITIPDKDVETIQTFGDMVELVKKQKNNECQVKPWE